MRSWKPLGRWWIWIVYILLFALSIPWYLPKKGNPEIWFGLPHWVVISLVATLCISFFTVFVIHRYWQDDEPDPAGRDHTP